MLTLDYRPNRFADLVGQKSVAPVLRALLLGGQVPSSLLFSGTRGCGKTSAGRIFAAALNCVSPEQGDACGVCERCVDVQHGRSSSVIEIDAASHGGVDDVRALQELVQFAVSGNYRVIILDEAHSMSRPAFNALLKVLEEGPPNTVFLLLTTEPDKIPDTVRSRCMHIPFRNVAPAAIAARLEHVCEKEGIEYEKLALEDISRKAEGSVRDALMVLDQVRHLGPATVDAVRQLRGHAPVGNKILGLFVTQDFKGGMDVGRSYFETSGDVGGLLEDLFEALQERFSSNAITSKQMIQATKLIWQARSLPPNRLTVESLLTLLYGLFHVEKPVKTNDMPILGADTIKSSKSSFTSLEELAALAEG